MKKILISALSIMFVSLTISAQDSGNTQDSFKPSGKPIVTVFSDFSHTSTNGNTNNAFELSRAYFGYGYNFSPDFSGKVVFDVANTSSLSPSAFTVFLKNAYAEYSHGIVKANLGLVGTTMFGLQESVWGKRYMYKSFQDQYGFGSSADLGASVKLQFIPELSLDLAIFNGEGYKQTQVDSTFQFAAGLTVQPIKNLFVRAYYDYKDKQSYLPSATKTAQNSFNLFVGYKSDKGSIGAEFDTQSGNKNTKNHNLSGISVYGTLPVAKQFSAIARFDNLTSKNDWNTSTDGQVYIAGIEFAPVKGIQITPNFRYSDLKTGNSTTSFNVNVGMSF
jgi:opacity protein-like surface antigen